MKKPSAKKISVIALICVLGVGVVWVSTAGQREAGAATTTKQKAMLTVTATKPQASDWPLTLTANGGIAAWQEAIVGSELGGLRLAAVNVNVGDIVHRGQILAYFASESVAADLAQQEATLEEARANLAEAQSNAARARTLANSGAISAQQTTQYMTAERSAQARLMSAEAHVKIEQIRLRQTQVVAPDDGVISSRSATLGAVTAQGQELFKLIRKNRLEWRAEVTSSDLLRIKPGQAVKLPAANGTTINGTVRMIAPTVDPTTRNAMVFVDLPIGSNVHAGMFSGGVFEIGHASALTVPHAAVMVRDGFGYVFRIDGDDKVAQTKVTLGRRFTDRIEIIDGVSADMLLVNQGAGFLADGDTVKVVAAVPAAQPAKAAAVGVAAISPTSTSTSK